MVGLVYISTRPEGTGLSGSFCGSSRIGVRRVVGISVEVAMDLGVDSRLTFERNASLSFSSSSSLCNSLKYSTFGP